MTTHLCPSFSSLAASMAVATAEPLEPPGNFQTRELCMYRRYTYLCMSLLAIEGSPINAHAVHACTCTRNCGCVAKKNH